jgi:DNA-binding MurR/RpiR family transcriptional regulator
MNVAIVGNRTGWTQYDVSKNLFKLLELNDTIISGGAEGVDTFAQEFAKEFGLKIIILYPNPMITSPQRYYERNQDIVDMADKVIAFQNKPYRSGTQSTINRAKKKGIPVIVIGKE